jgi:hypothetical protein
LDLDQIDVSLLGEQVLNGVAGHLDPAAVVVMAARRSNRFTMPKCKAPPADRARGTHPRMGCGRSATHAAFNCSDKPVSLDL